MNHSISFAHEGGQQLPHWVDGMVNHTDAGSNSNQFGSRFASKRVKGLKDFETGNDSDSDSKGAASSSSCKDGVEGNRASDPMPIDVIMTVGKAPPGSAVQEGNNTARAQQEQVAKEKLLRRAVSRHTLGAKTIIGAEQHENQEQQGGVRSGDSDIMDGMDEAGANYTDYKRGQRCRKLSRQLGSAQVLHVLRQFKVRALLCISAMVLVHLVTFIVMLVLVERIQQQVVKLNSVANASRNTHEVCIRIRSLDFLSHNLTVPALRGFSNSQEELESSLQDLDETIHNLRELHTMTYFSLGTGLRGNDGMDLFALWNTPVLPSTVYLPTVLTPTVYEEKISLWDLGNKYITASQSVLTNARQWSLDEAPDLSTLPDYQYVDANGPGPLWLGYSQTLNVFTDFTVADNHNMNNVHLIILGVEGVLLTLLSVVYMWRMSQAVDVLRYQMYSVFITIPMALVRSLAVKVIRLEKDDDDDDDLTEDTAGIGVGADLTASMQRTLSEHEAQSRAASSKNESLMGRYRSMYGAGGSQAQGAQKPGSAPMKRVTVMVADAEDSGHDGNAHLHDDDAAYGDAEGSTGHEQVTPQGPASLPLRQLIRSASDTFMAWQSGFIYPRSLEQQQQQGRTSHPKRVLQRSNQTALWLVWPFVLWGVVVIILAAVRYDAVKKIEASVALLNIVNFSIVRLHRIAYFTMNYVGLNSTDPERPTARARLASELELLHGEMHAMLYGTLPPNFTDTTGHFSRLTQGVATSNSPYMGLLYSTEPVCLCEDKSKCLPPDSLYYQYVSYGLEPMVREYLNAAETLLAQDPAGVNLSHPAFQFMWTVAENDIEGGLDALDIGYLGGLQASFDTTARAHIMQFVLVVILALAFYFFMVWPFMKETRGEARRIAELLSQLPQEVDVETMVTRAMAVPSRSLNRSDTEKLSIPASLGPGANGMSAHVSPGHGLISGSAFSVTGSPNTVLPRRK